MTTELVLVQLDIGDSITQRTEKINAALRDKASYEIVNIGTGFEPPYQVMLYITIKRISINIPTQEPQWNPGVWNIPYNTIPNTLTGTTLTIPASTSDATTRGYVNALDVDFNGGAGSGTIIPWDAATTALGNTNPENNVPF